MQIDLPDDVVVDIMQNRDAYISILHALRGRIIKDMLYENGNSPYGVSLRPRSYRGIPIRMMYNIMRTLNIDYAGWQQAYFATVEMREVSPDLKGWEPFMSQSLRQETLMARRFYNKMKVHRVISNKEGILDLDTNKILRIKETCYIYTGDLRL